MRALVATKDKRLFAVEFVVYTNEETDTVLKFEEDVKKVALIVGMPCERHDLKRLEYFECAANF